MPRWEDVVLIDRPVDEVWSFLTDWFNTPRLGGYSALGLRQTSPGPLGVGSTLQGRNVILGIETRLNHRFTEWDPPHAFADTIEGRPFRSLVQRGNFESTATGTKFVVTTEFELRPPLKLIWPIIQPLARRKMLAGMRQMKEVMEAAPR